MKGGKQHPPDDFNMTWFFRKSKVEKVKTPQTNDRLDVSDKPFDTFTLESASELSRATAESPSLACPNAPADYPLLEHPQGLQRECSGLLSMNF